MVYVGQGEPMTLTYLSSLGIRTCQGTIAKLGINPEYVKGVDHDQILQTSFPLNELSIIVCKIWFIFNNIHVFS